MGLHRLGYLEEAGDVGSGNVIACHTVLLSRLEGVLVYVNHDSFELLIDLFWAWEGSVQGLTWSPEDDEEQEQASGSSSW